MEVGSALQELENKVKEFQHDTIAGFSFNFFQMHHILKPELPKLSVEANAINSWQ